MKSRVKLIFSFLMMMVPLQIFFSNCQSRFNTTDKVDQKAMGGTGVGNPMTAQASKLLTAACDIIARCHPEITETQCEIGMSGTGGFDYQIGLPTGQFASFKSVIDAEAKGTVSADITAFNACNEMVSQLSCDSPQVQGAFISNLGDHYWGAPRLFLQDLCSNVFKNSIAQGTERFHYIRRGATGSGDGSDWNNACPGFVGVCAGDQLTRGHTYYVASGDYDSVTFNVPGEDLITVKKATQTEHGTSMGWADTYAQGPAVFPDWTFQSSHWVIDGQDRSSLITGHGFQINLPRLNKDCARNFCNAILLDSASQVDRVTLRYVEVVGFGVNSNRNLNGLYSVPGDGTSSNIVLYGVSMHDFGVYNGNSPIKTAGKGVLNLTFDNSAIIRSAARAVDDSGSNNVIFRNSWFENISDQGIIVVYGGQTTQNWEIYGNVFWESDPLNYGIDYGVIQCTGQSTCNNWLIANNTIAGFTSERTKIANVNFLEASPQTSGTQVVNNIWFNSFNVDFLGNGLTHEYNSYLSCSSTPTNESFAVIEAQNPFVNSVAGDFHLAAPSAIGRVLTVPYNRDRENKLRGYDGHWDRGAYEF
ncbi:MAG: hypothetical protein ACXVB4_03940 [Pseudobdellovibrionaceae bacterium]